MPYLAREAPVPPETLGAIDLELASAGLAIEDLSAATTGRKGPCRVEAVDVATLLTEAVEAFRPLAVTHGTELSLQWTGEPGVIRADRLRVAQATGNLIANAIEHGHGSVELRGRTGNGGLEISVADAGPGLPAPVTDLVARSRAGRGRRGRGLAIAADVAERHGGRLHSDGSSVTLELPPSRGPTLGS